jgi:hypothetical protein
MRVSPSFQRPLNSADRASQRSHDPANRESLEALAPGDKVHMRRAVLEHVRDCCGHGATADEATEALGIGHNSVAPRFVELHKQGLIVKLGPEFRRRTRLGCLASVFVAAEFAPRPESETPVSPEFGDLAAERYPD